MGRMIDADKLIDHIKLKYGMYPIYFVDDKTPWGRQAEIDTALIDLLERAASKEAESVKRGKWMTKNIFMPDHYGGYYINQFVCTNCESEFFKPSNYCPNCGADMREEETNGTQK